jgi:hypothetical protein
MLFVVAGLAKWQIGNRSGEWQVVDTGRFSFSLPPDMWANRVQGIGSFVAEFQHSTIVSQNVCTW